MAKLSFFGGSPVCGVVAAPDAREMLLQLRRALRLSRTVELRLDWLAGPREFRRFLIFLGREELPGGVLLIATCRREAAGGRFSGGVNAQLAILRCAIAAGCRWIDLEIESLRALSPFTLDLCTAGGRRILSFHDFAKTEPSLALRRVFRNLQRVAQLAHFDAVKIATACHSLAEGLRVTALARPGRNIIAVPMGDAAAPLRVLAPRLGSALAYAPFETSTAPGQISFDSMNRLYRAGEITRQTRLYGVIGNPISHSLSPVLHNAGFRSRRVNAVYLPFLAADLGDFLHAILALGVAGFSVTLPHKQRILRFLDDCDPLAAEIGAVNTVVVRGRGKLFGYNTDYVGVLRALERRLPLRGSRSLIFGAGGVARAVAFALARSGASVAICARRDEQARKLARAVHGETIPRAALRREFFDAVVNATPVGMYPRADRSPLEARELNCRVVFDAIYRPRQTKLLRLAAARGIAAVSGLEMFLAQGVAQWEIWMGERAPEAAMRRAVVAALRAEEQEAN